MNEVFEGDATNRNLIYVGYLTHHALREGSDMERFIVRANIAHLRDKLAVEQDERQRQTLMRLLADEEAKQAKLEKDQPKEKRRGD